MLLNGYLDTDLTAILVKFSYFSAKFHMEFFPDVWQNQWNIFKNFKFSANNLSKRVDFAIAQYVFVYGDNISYLHFKSD